MTLDQLMELVVEFRDEREWRKFHTPKDLAAAISIEVSELQQLFLWKGYTECRNTVLSSHDVDDEVADIAIFLLSFCNVCQIDIEEAIKAKLHRNALRYPASQCRGSSAKVTNEVTA